MNKSIFNTLLMNSPLNIVNQIKQVKLLKYEADYKLWSTSGYFVNLKNAIEDVKKFKNTLEWIQIKRNTLDLYNELPRDKKDEIILVLGMHEVETTLENIIAFILLIATFVGLETKGLL